MDNDLFCFGLFIMVMGIVVICIFLWEILDTLKESKDLLSKLNNSVNASELQDIISSLHDTVDEIRDIMVREGPET